jgi:hypothetical protein
MQRGTRPPALPPRENLQRPTQPGLRQERTGQPISQPVLRNSGVSRADYGEPPPARSVPARSHVQPTAAGALHAQRLSSSAAREAAAAADAEVERMGDQIVELLERLRASEDRIAYTEQMLHAANAAVAAANARAQAAEAEPAPARSSAAGYVPWIVLAMVSGLAAAGYVLSYAPLQQRYEAQVKLDQEQAAQQSQALASLRSGFDAERQKLQTELADAKAAAQPAQAAPAAPSGDATAPAGAVLSAERAQPRSHASAEERAAKLEEKKAEREARREAWLAKKAERQAKREEASAARKSKKSSSDDSDDSSSARAKPEPAAKPSKPAHEDLSPSSGGDDPLEGL